MLTPTNSLLLKMPTEILFHIFHFLKLKECAKQQEVCRLFNEIFNTDYFWNSYTQVNNIPLPLCRNPSFTYKNYIIKLFKTYHNFSIIWNSCTGKECSSGNKLLPVILNTKTGFANFDNADQVSDQGNLRVLQFAESKKYTKQDITKVYYQKLADQKICNESIEFGILFSSTRKYEPIQNCHIIQTNPELSDELKEELLQIEQITSRLIKNNQKDLITEKDFNVLSSTAASPQFRREQSVETCPPA